MVEKSKLIKKPFISAFFPCYNDAGTIASMVELSMITLKKITNRYEVIVVDDGSSDWSRTILKSLAKNNPSLKLIFHDKNQGYGGALISGFKNSSGELIFYTDGDFQYDVSELEKLYLKLDGRVDIVQGYKVKRNDPWYRIVIGDVYNFGVKFLFGIRIKDVDCDFRLIRKKVFEKVNLSHKSGVITVEMVKKIQDAGFKFSEVPVSHFHRTYGRSQIFNFKRITRILIELTVLWKELVFNKWQKKISLETRKYS